MLEILKRDKAPLLIIGIAFLCWGRLLFLRGIWWDDWAWVWQYFGSANFSEFMLPFHSLRHELDGYLLFSSYKLFDIFREDATNIWNIAKFTVFTVNSLLIYYIAKKLLNGKSILPKAIAIIYLASPIVNNICLVEFNRRLYLFFFLSSILFSVTYVTKRRSRIIYYLLALSFFTISMCGIESIIFFELLRPVIIFYIFYKKQREPLSTSAQKTFFYWFPFLAIGIIRLIYSLGLITPRTGLYAHAYDSGLSVGFKSILSLVHTCGRSVYNLFASFVYFFVKKHWLIKRDFFLILLSFITAWLGWLVIFKNEKTAGKENKPALNEAKTVIVFGIISTIAAFLPYLITRGGYCIGTMSRHGLLLSIGVSILIPSILFALYYKGLIKKWFCCLFFGGVIFLGAFQCNSMVESYSADWQQQRSFWWQFMRRVPDLKDNTYLIIDTPREEKVYFEGWRGSYEFACPLNLLYAKSRDSSEINNHFANTSDGSFIDKDLEKCNKYNRKALQAEFFSGGSYSYYPENLIVASYHNGYVYLNDEIDKSNSSKLINIETLKPHFSAGQIIYKTNNVEFPFRWLIGPESKRDFKEE